MARRRPLPNRPSRRHRRHRGAHRPSLFPPGGLEILLGDPAKAREELDWTLATTLEELVAEMVAAEREDAKKEPYLKHKGFQVMCSMENPPNNPEVIAAARQKG
jgi:GDPmannose 4,6-dehydratase